MADTDSVASSQQQITSISPQTASGTAQPGEHTCPSAENAVPLFDIIDTCLEKLPALREITPSQCARACLLSDNVLEIHSNYPIRTSPSLNPTSLLRKLVNLDHTEHAVLVIDDINAERFQAPATWFPKSLDVKFLAQHVLRLSELNATYRTHDGLVDECKALAAQVDAELSRRLPPTTARRDF